MACLACFFFIFTAIGIGIAIVILGQSVADSNGDGGDNVPPPSPQLQAFLDDVLGVNIDFSLYDSTSRNDEFIRSYKAESLMGGPITQTMQNLNNEVAVPKINTVMK